MVLKIFRNEDGVIDREWIISGQLHLVIGRCRNNIICLRCQPFNYEVEEWVAEAWG